MLDLLSLLREKGAITASEYDILKNTAVANREKVAKIKMDVEAKTKDLPIITLKGKYSIGSQDSQHSFTPIGRIYRDTILVDDDESTNVSGGSELRRSRLGFEAKMFNNWKAKLEYDFAGSDADLKDGYIAYENSNSTGKYNIKVGQHHVPIGFHTISNSKYMSFLRRPLFADDPLQPARQYGISAQFYEKNYRWNIIAGWFLDEPGDGAVNVTGAGEDRQYISIRATGIPVMKDKTHLLHIGASFMNSDPKGDALRIRQRVLSHLNTSRLLDTGSLGINVKDINTWDLELLGIYRPLYGLYEYIHISADDPDGDANFKAWSIEGGWLLTGKSKKFDQAAFGSISPKRDFSQGGIGAWEIALRYENMDLKDEIYRRKC